jgi:hypothetical protein
VFVNDVIRLRVFSRFDFLKGNLTWVKLAPKRDRPFGLDMVGQLPRSGLVMGYDGLSGLSTWLSDHW